MILENYSDARLNLPPELNYLEEVKNSCTELVHCCDNKFELNFKDYIKKIEVSTFTQHVKSYTHWCDRFPFKFDTAAAEINFMIIVEMLTGVFGYQPDEISAKLGGEMDQFILAGCISLFLSYTELDSKILRELTVLQISENFRIPLSKEEPALKDPKTGEYISGMTIMKPTVLQPLAKGIVNVLNGVGKILDTLGSATVGDLIVNKFKDTTSGNDVVKFLVNTFPYFNDSTKIEIDGGEKVVRLNLFSSATRVCLNLHRNHTKLFNFSDVDNFLVILPFTYDFLYTQKIGILSLNDNRSGIDNTNLLACQKSMYATNLYISIKLTEYYKSMMCCAQTPVQESNISAEPSSSATVAAIVPYNWFIFWYSYEKSMKAGGDGSIYI
ncbi:hypothetical protein AX774_g5817 [Zancudomyces culisetae]|uniref:Uncharacterized protein n=1 Tax=Zancudomyces culisetae TaxID=1213189 RepID=A0A1R1PIF3_ZANCU|nr:hypothetical protein AX774_g5817 [Zancudomyces culisetae]|eukprot:OMH80737.1 hypothetical protein AX774_g5817 [Zancudomyces culisetae]